MELMIGASSIGLSLGFFDEIPTFPGDWRKISSSWTGGGIAVAKKHLDLICRVGKGETGNSEMRRPYTNYFRGMPTFKQ